jgi:hypothetical protein
MEVHVAVYTAEELDLLADYVLRQAKLLRAQAKTALMPGLQHDGSDVGRNTAGQQSMPDIFSGQSSSNLSEQFIKGRDANAFRPNDLLR